MTPEARRQLRALIEREQDDPREPTRLQEEVREQFPDLEPALRLLALKDELD